MEKINKAPSRGCYLQGRQQPSCPSLLRWPSHAEACRTPSCSCSTSPCTCSGSASRKACRCTQRPSQLRPPHGYEQWSQQQRSLQRTQIIPENSLYASKEDLRGISEMRFLVVSFCHYGLITSDEFLKIVNRLFSAIY